MRIRTVKPEFWSNEDLARVSAETALLAIGLLNFSDDEGYFHANPQLIQSAIFPLRKLSMNVHGMLIELLCIGYIRVHREVEKGKVYGHVVNFTKHQKVCRPYPSRIKDLCKFIDDSWNVHGVFPEHSLQEWNGIGIGKGTGNRKPPLPPRGDAETADADNFGLWSEDRFREEAAKANADKMLTESELTDFCAYWLQKDKRGRYLFVLQKTWDMKRRQGNALARIYMPKRQSELRTSPDELAKLKREAGVESWTNSNES